MKKRIASKKGEILGLSNTPEVLWYKFRPEDLTLELLDDIFDIYDKLYCEDIDKTHSYKFHTSPGDIYFPQERKKYRAYFIFTKTTAHLILTKTLAWKKFDKEIEKKFEFVKIK